jgi:hypothetical protein
VTAVRDVLRDAAELLRTRGWTQGYYARDTDSRWQDADSSDAACFCVMGAIMRVAGSDTDPRAAVAFGLVRRVIGSESIGVWNDAPGRTLAEVLTTLERAVDLAGAA